MKRIALINPGQNGEGLSGMKIGKYPLLSLYIYKRTNGFVSSLQTGFSVAFKQRSILEGLMVGTSKYGIGQGVKKALSER